jgi:hypothetical protein
VELPESMFGFTQRSIDLMSAGMSSVEGGPKMMDLSGAVNGARWRLMFWSFRCLQNTTIDHSATLVSIAQYTFRTGVLVLQRNSLTFS